MELHLELVFIIQYLTTFLMFFKADWPDCRICLCSSVNFIFLLSDPLLSYIMKIICTFKAQQSNSKSKQQ